MLFLQFLDRNQTVSRLISWKNPFERLNEEYELTQKKKEALDRLHDDGKISQSTYDSFNKKIDEAISEIERQQKVLLEKMNSKAQELEKHIKTLETLLANFEIRHVTGEVEEEVYQREVDLLSIGLETAKGELDGVKEAVGELSRGIPIQSPEIGTSDEEEETQTGENIQSEIEEEETPQVVEIETTADEIEEPTLPEPPIDTSKDDTEETIYKREESQETQEIESQETEEETESWQDTEKNEETTQALEEEVQQEEENEEPQEMW